MGNMSSIVPFIVTVILIVITVALMWFIVHSSVKYGTDFTAGVKTIVNDSVEFDLVSDYIMGKRSTYPDTCKHIVLEWEENVKPQCPECGLAFVDMAYSLRRKRVGSNWTIGKLIGEGTYNAVFILTVKDRIKRLARLSKGPGNNIDDVLNVTEAYEIIDNTYLPKISIGSFTMINSDASDKLCPLWSIGREYVTITPKMLADKALLRSYIRTIRKIILDLHSKNRYYCDWKCWNMGRLKRNSQNVVLLDFDIVPPSGDFGMSYLFNYAELWEQLKSPDVFSIMDIVLALMEIVNAVINGGNDNAYRDFMRHDDRNEVWSYKLDNTIGKLESWKRLKNVVNQSLTGGYTESMNESDYGTFIRVDTTTESSELNETVERPKMDVKESALLYHYRLFTDVVNELQSAVNDD